MATLKPAQKETAQPTVASVSEHADPAREAAFVLWKGRSVFLPGDSEPLPQDGLAYQEKFRSEW
jgi:hypothetical protein